jgi:hypothetical protein
MTLTLTLTLTLTTDPTGRQVATCVGPLIVGATRRSRDAVQLVLPPRPPSAASAAAPPSACRAPLATPSQSVER